VSRAAFWSGASDEGFRLLRRLAGSPADGWVHCCSCDRVCALEDSIARAMRMGALAAKREKA
jgi:hypothetical protein